MLGIWFCLEGVGLRTQQRQSRPKTRCSRPSVHSIASFSASIGSILKGMLKSVVQGHNSCFIPWTGQVPSFPHTAYLSWRKRLSEHLVETGKSLAKTASRGRLGQLILKDFSATRGAMERVSDFSLCGSYSEICITMSPESFTAPIVGMCIVSLSTVWASKCTNTSVASGKPFFNWNSSRSVADCNENSSMNSFSCIRALVAPCQSGDIEAKPEVFQRMQHKNMQKYTDYDHGNKNLGKSCQLILESYNLVLDLGMGSAAGIGEGGVCRDTA